MLVSDHGLGFPMFDQPKRNSRPRDPFRCRCAFHSGTPCALWCLLLILAPCGLTALLTGCGTTFPKIATQKTGNLVAAPAKVTFGSVAVGQTATRTLTLTNSGSASLQIATIQFSSADFSLPGTVSLPLTLAAGQSSDLTLEFTPSAGGAESATMTFTIAYNPTPATVALSGTGVAPTPGILLQSTSVNFGDVMLNTSTTQDDIITASGTGSLTITGATETGAGFTVSGLTFPITLKPQQTATLHIGFDPTAAGPDPGQVTLATNTPSGSATIALSGTGVAQRYQVNLTWDAPVGFPYAPFTYQVYRTANNSAVYSLLDTTATTAYSDLSVQNGGTYSYYVVSISAQDNSSAPSDVYTANIPN